MNYFSGLAGYAENKRANNDNNNEESDNNTNADD